MSGSSGQTFYSERSKETLDESSRLFKARKISSVLADYTATDMGSWRCLDVGSSGGIISRYFGGVFRQVVGVDLDVQALGFARQYNDRDNVAFVQGSGCVLPFGDGQFDVAICNHIYEHVPDVRALFDQVYRVLRPGGVCYLACTNKYWVLEPHYNLLFLSWMPRQWSNIYLRLTGRGSHYKEQLRSRTQILELASRFRATEYTLRIFESPRQFNATDVEQRWVIARLVPTGLARLLLFWMPNFVWILRKPQF